jgi:hypothetical protein
MERVSACRPNCDGIVSGLVPSEIVNNMDTTPLPPSRNGPATVANQNSLARARRAACAIDRAGVCQCGFWRVIADLSASLF